MKKIVYTCIVIFLSVNYNALNVLQIRRLINSQRVDKDAKIYFSVCSQNNGSLSNGFRKKVNSFFIQLKNDGNFFTNDRIFLYANENSIAARISLVNPFSSPVTEVNNPTFEQFIGYHGDGTTSYLNTNFNPSVSGLNFLQNSASYSWYVYTGGGSNYDVGVISGSNASIANQGVFSINGGSTFITGTSTMSKVLNSVVRINASTMQFFQFGIMTNNVTSSSMPDNTLPYFTGCFNNLGSPSFFSAAKYSFYSFGSSSVNQIKLNSSVTSFLSKIQ